MSGLVKSGQVNLDQILSQDRSSQVGIEQIKLRQVKLRLVISDRSSKKKFVFKFQIVGSSSLSSFQNIVGPNIFSELTFF